MPVIVEGGAHALRPVSSSVPLGFSRPIPSTWPKGRPPYVAAIGEAGGREEAAQARPFVGQSGRLLRMALTQAGIAEDRVMFANVFGCQPPENDLKAFTVPRTKLPADYPPGLPALQQGRYVHPAWFGEVERLRQELVALAPHLVVALGNTACWALFGEPPKISKVRGAPRAASLVPGLKVLPTYHPAAVLRNAGLYPILLADLHKAAYEAQFREVRRPPRWIGIAPGLEAIEAFVEECLAKPPPWPIGFDIETSTKGGSRQITCLSIAPAPNLALVVPFVNRDGSSFWADTASEARAWRAVFAFLTSPVPKVLQNGSYDSSWVWDLFRVPTRGWVHDTLFEHHARYPELPRSLGFLGSLYTLETAWKFMRPKGREKSEKRDE